MTVSAYISHFLKSYESLEIDMNHVSDGSDQYGLFKSPSREVKEFGDSSCEITEHYQFLARQSGVSKSERKEMDEWLEDLTYWIDDYPYTYDYPILGKGRRVTALSVAGSPYSMSADDREILYQIQLSITYTREREET